MNLKGTLTLSGSKNYPYLNHIMHFSLGPPPHWKFRSNFIHLLKFFGLWEPSTPPGISNPFCGGEYGSGTTDYVKILSFQCHAIKDKKCKPLKKESLENERKKI